MNKVLQRLLTFFIGIPVVVGIICLSYLNHLLLNVVLVLCSVLMTIELHNLFSVNIKMPNLIFTSILSASLPIVSYLTILFCPQNADNFTHWTFIILCLILMVYEVFAHKTFEESNKRLSASIFEIFYCGFLITFITRMSLFENSTIVISLFLVTIFMNDSIAWFFGMLFGKNNRGFVAVSPNKSIVGFIGGYLGAILVCILASYLFPEIMNAQNQTMSIIKAVILGFVTATAGIVGDLTESVFKRSANKKDSGAIIPGRGGLLDSCDSIVFAAPIFYIVFTLLYNPSLITTVQNLAK